MGGDEDVGKGQLSLRGATVMTETAKTRHDCHFVVQAKGGTGAPQDPQKFQNHQNVMKATPPLNSTLRF